MGTRFIILIFLSGIVFTMGCTTLRRYSSLAVPETNNTIADIDLFGLDLSVPEPGMNFKSLWDLSADAQSQFIKILNTRYSDNEEFLNTFNISYMNEVNKISIDNYTNRDLRLVFSVSKKRKFLNDKGVSGINISPADRLEYLRISLKIPDDSVLSFKSWKMFATEYGSVDVGDVSFSKTLQLNTAGSLSIDKGKTGGDMSTSGTALLSRKEDQSVKYRYLLLNGRINSRKIEMEEEGTREIDLTGNIIADVTLAFNAFPETLTLLTGLLNSTGQFNDPERIIIDYQVVNVPGMREIKDTVKADLQMDYVYRNVVQGSKTFPEWDDRVKYYTGTVKKTIPLFTARDYVPDLYCIGLNENRRELLKVKAPNNFVYELKFRSHVEASAFYSWLIQYFSKNENQETGLKIGGQQLIFKDGNLTFGQIKGNSRFGVLPYYK